MLTVKINTILIIKPSNQRILYLEKNGISPDNALYEVTRYAWVISLSRAKKINYVLAGVVKEVYKVNWKRPENEPRKNRYCFDGVIAEPQVRNIYIDKQISAKYRNKGAANPARYRKI